MPSPGRGSSVERPDPGAVRPALHALVRPVSASLAECELTHLTRVAIDVPRAAAQHAAYVAALRGLGVTVDLLPPADELPDAVFIEDTAVVLEEVAIITRPGAASRRAETAAVARALEPHRPLLWMNAPETLDGGDVLRVDRTLYVGLSERSNDAGIRALQALTSPYGFEVVPVEFAGCLHLKTAVTVVGNRLLLLNPAWVDPAAFPGCDWLAVDPAEPFAANALQVGAAVVHGRDFTRTRLRLETEDIPVVPVAVDELAKAEGGVTCCCLLFSAPGAQQETG